ncbi:YtxH domain-containing protein [Flavobacterium sp. J49]|uniref:YtxH domain-containing protein n=1 Tax=Flavobacterium sp. J49 TaxID=2718534 RepID=UPI001592B2D4|nr:YtxH domain-containing protein [Flavobacterium sp. J49]MBF6641967.1 YtxH domain-containing protein [Flavobacterium sp. J49]NIC03214.1 YtxH domain-containing protein [Flavobacterium sp. J49]
MNTNKIVLGVISGIAIGAVAGILFAPAKGSKTRKRIMKKGNNYTNELKTKFEEMYHNAANQYDSAVEQTKEFATDHQPK